MRDLHGRGIGPAMVGAAVLAMALLLARTPAATAAGTPPAALGVDARGRTPAVPRATVVVRAAPTDRAPSPAAPGSVPEPPNPDVVAPAAAPPPPSRPEPGPRPEPNPALRPEPPDPLAAAGPTSGPPGEDREVPRPPPGAGEVAPGARYSWPLLPPPAVLTAFDEPVDPYGRGHRGIDLAGVTGQPVLAAQEGVVVHAGPLAGRGVVSVSHADGLRTTYEPVTAAVTVGATVARGAVLGTLDAGHGGCPGACLHWGVRRDRLDYVDPLVLLRPPRVRLLPVSDPWPLQPRV